MQVAGYSGAKKEYKPINDKAIIPMAIHQVTEELREDSIFQGQSFFTVSIVGRLAQFRRESNYNMFLFTDGTGQVQGRINLTSGKMPSFTEGMNFESLGSEYYFVVFKPRFSDGQKKYYIQMIKSVDNYNTITKHISDVILSTLVRRKS